MKKITQLFVTLSLLFVLTFPASAYVDDAHSFALEAAKPYVRQGFLVRQEYWAGGAAVNQPSVITHQLFKGNDYWFWMATDEESAQVTIHVYDANGKLADTESWQKGRAAGVHVVAKKTGAFYLVLTVERSKLKNTHWAIAYGYK